MAWGPTRTPVVHRASVRPTLIEAIGDLGQDLAMWMTGCPATFSLKVAALVLFVAALVFAGVLAAVEPLP